LGGRRGGEVMPDSRGARASPWLKCDASAPATGFRQHEQPQQPAVPRSPRAVQPRGSAGTALHASSQASTSLPHPSLACFAGRAFVALVTSRGMHAAPCAQPSENLRLPLVAIVLPLSVLLTCRWPLWLAASTLVLACCAWVSLALLVGVQQAPRRFSALWPAAGSYHCCRLLHRWKRCFWLAWGLVKAGGVPVISAGHLLDRWPCCRSARYGCAHAPRCLPACLSTLP